MHVREGALAHSYTTNTVIFGSDFNLALWQFSLKSLKIATSGGADNHQYLINVQTLSAHSCCADSQDKCYSRTVNREAH